MNIVFVAVVVLVVVVVVVIVVVDVIVAFAVVLVVVVSNECLVCYWWDHSSIRDFTAAFHMGFCRLDLIFLNTSLGLSFHASFQTLFIFISFIECYMHVEYT